MRTIGITGTSSGWTPGQEKSFRLWLRKLKERGIDTFRGGDCVGVDKQAHEIAVELGLRTIGHPPVNPRARAFCKYDEELPLKPYLERNHDIVNNSDIMIACPSSFKWFPHSGTWATITYSRKRKPLLIIYPDGTVETINWIRKCSTEEDTLTMFLEGTNLE